MFSKESDFMPKFNMYENIYIFISIIHNLHHIISLCNIFSKKCEY